jgi:hypothetical protein
MPGQPPFWVDAIQCVNNPVAINATGGFGFEEGFVPPEFGSNASGAPSTALKVGDWWIDNSSPFTGTFSAHPPLMDGSATKSLSFACGGKAHTQISFVYRGLAPAAGQTLKFYIDDVLNQTFGQTSGNNFTTGGMTFSSAATHTYRWDASTAPTVPAQPPFWVDVIQCQ